MATRNLTRQFLEIRSGAKANRSLRKDESSDETDSELLSSRQGENTNWKAVKAALPPAWVEKIENIEEDITKIQTRMKDLSNLHSKRLMVNFEADEAAQEREIELVTAEVTQIFRHAEALLKKFSKIGDESGASQAELKVRANMQKSVAKRLQTLSMAFRSSQKDYLSRLQSQKAGGGSEAFEFLDNSKKGASPVPMEDHGFTKGQMMVVEDIEMLVNERDQEIVNIAKSIEELAAIFRELAVLVIDQGTILDRIDYNMECAVEHAKEGMTHLEKAEEHQKNALPFKCIVILIILIIIMLGILIWKHSGK